MFKRPTGLPVEAALPELMHALASGNSAVLQAPPGAGKTTLVPLALLHESWMGGDRIVMLEPRRLAARAAAHRMAFLLGEGVSETVGYRVRHDTRVGPRTRIEVVTEGVLTRMLHDDPTLGGIALVIFDEFHERSIHADLGLALTLQLQQLVRPALRILVMSATLETAPIAKLLGDAAVVTSQGRRFPILTHYLPARVELHPAARVAGAIRTALAQDEGDVLVFLPGAREIAEVERRLGSEALPPGLFVAPLFGAMALDAQDRAIAPAPAGARKIVLATSIAETSLTIEGVRVVIDSGLTRVARFSSRTGMTRLETVRVSRAVADQRRGRAGRVAPGVCYRLWDEHETAGLVPFATPEILETDLVPLALDLAMAGVGDVSDLAWIDRPPAAPLARARELLRELDALTSDDRVTAHGRALAGLGTHPRIAHMLVRAGEMGAGPAAAASDLAAILDERDFLRGEGGPPPSDIGLRLAWLQRGGTRQEPGAFNVDHALVQRVRRNAAEWRRRVSAERGIYDDSVAGPLLALAYPDRVAMRRPGRDARFVMRDGGGGMLRADDALAPSEFLAVAETDGRRPESRIALAAPLHRDEVERVFGHQVVERDVVEWDWDADVVRAERRRELGSLVLATRVIAHPPAAGLRAAIERAIAQRGLQLLPWQVGARALRERLAFLHAHDPSWPDVGDEALLSTLDGWLGPQLERVQRRDDLSRVDLTAALESLLDWRQRAALDQLAPTHVGVPTGSRLPIDYADPRSPVLAVRLQEMFGCADTPRVLGGKVPLTLHLLSPSQRPVQVTRDLAGFWRDAYFDVRRDLRGRYPKHAWPDDPMTATPTRRTRRPGVRDER